MTSYAHYDTLQQGVWFSIEIGGDEFVAFIAEEALTNHFKAPKHKNGQLTAYKKNHRIIDLVAHQRFIAGFPRPINLSTIDFQFKTEGFGAAAQRRH